MFRTLFFVLLCFFYSVPPTMAQTLVFAVDANYPPMEMVDDEGQIIGFGPDMVRAIAKEAGFIPEFRPSPWATIFNGLENKEYDVVISSVSVTEERKERVDFSEPYYQSYQVVITCSDSEYAGVTDLSGKKIAAQEDTTSFEHCKKIARFQGAYCKPFPTSELALMALHHKTLDAVILDAPAAFSLALNKAEYQGQLKVGFLIPSDNPENFAMAVRKGDSKTLELLNKGLQRIRDNGAYTDIYQKWLAQIPAEPTSSPLLRLPWFSSTNTYVSQR